MAERRLAVQLQPQQHWQWCWAAVTAAVVSFFSPAAAVQQCFVVNRLLDTRTCCWAGALPWCNLPYYTDQALERYDRLAAVEEAAGSLAAVQAEIDQGRPVVFVIVWPSKTSHVGVITGYSDDFLTVADPSWAAGEERDIAYDDMLQRYPRKGKWKRTFYTRP